jgi:hypothetical protein
MSRFKMGAALLAAAASAVLATQPATTAAASQPERDPAQTLTVTIVGASTAPRFTDCTYTAQVSGGTAPYFFSWIGVTGDPNAQTTEANWSTIGNKTLWVDVEDALGATGSAGKGVTVLSSGSC